MYHTSKLILSAVLLFIINHLFIGIWETWTKHLCTLTWYWVRRLTWRGRSPNIGIRKATPHRCSCMRSKQRFPASDDYFQEQTNRTIKNLRIPDGFIVATQSKAWMDEDLMVQWIKEIWVLYITSKGGRESILCLDSFRAHLTDSVVPEYQKHRIHKAVIPGGCTSVLQPLDVSLKFQALTARGRSSCFKVTTWEKRSRGRWSQSLGQTN